MKRAIALVVTVLTACAFTIVMITGWSVGRGIGVAGAASGPAVATATSTTPHMYLVINTPAMLGGDENTGPALVPSAFTLPANTVVAVTIVNFDGATALPPGAKQFATASGVSGAVTTQALDAVHPNLLTAATSANSLNPVTGISHTFTIAALGLNVPLAPNSRTTFTFTTGPAGVYQWRCMDPCGNGPAGWGAAMSTEGFMQGKVTFG